MNRCCDNFSSRREVNLSCSADAADHVGEFLRFSRRRIHGLRHHRISRNIRRNRRSDWTTRRFCGRTSDWRNGYPLPRPGIPPMQLDQTTLRSRLLCRCPLAAASGEKVRGWGRALQSTLACALSGWLLLAGCESQPAADSSSPKVSDSKPVDDADEILPPQSEPPVVDDKSPAEESDTDDPPAEDKPATGK
jgi:hypothetical protein